MDFVYTQVTAAVTTLGVRFQCIPVGQMFRELSQRALFWLFDEHVSIPRHLSLYLFRAQMLMALSSWPKKKMMMFMMLTLVICWSGSYFSQCWRTLFNQNNLAHTQSHFQERWIQWNIKTNPNINSAKKIGLLGKNHKKIYSEIKHLSATFLVKCSIVLQCNAWRMTAWRHSKSGLISTTALAAT